MGSSEIILVDQREEDCLRKLREFVKESSELEDFSAFLTDRFLLHFIRGKKYDSQAAFSTLKHYIRVRKNIYPEMFKSLRPSSSQQAFSTGFCRFLKHPDKHGRIVSVQSLGGLDLSKTALDDILKMIALCIEELMNNEKMEKNGIVQICDLSEFNWRHARHCNPYNLHKTLNIFYSGFPVKFKGYHFMNEISLFKMLFKALRGFLPKKIQHRFYLHSTDYSGLHEHFSRDILPQSLGGNLTDEEAFMDHDEFIDRILAKEEHYKKFAELL